MSESKAKPPEPFTKPGQNHQLHPARETRSETHTRIRWNPLPQRETLSENPFGNLSFSPQKQAQATPNQSSKSRLLLARALLAPWGRVWGCVVTYERLTRVGGWVPAGGVPFIRRSSPTARACPAEPTCSSIRSSASRHWCVRRGAPSSDLQPGTSWAASRLDGPSTSPRQSLDR